MKKLFVIGLLGSLTFANNLDTLLGRMGMSSSQVSNLKNGVSSALSGRNGTRPTVASENNYTLGQCIDLVDKERQRQIDEGSEMLSIGYALGSFSHRVLRGGYTQFFDQQGRDSSFGRSLKRGLPSDSRVRFNSMSRTPQAIYRCNQYMDISKVEIVNLDGKECRKITMEIKGEIVKTNESIKHNFSNYYCVGEVNLKVDFLDHKSELIEKIEEEVIEYDHPEYE